MTNNSAGQRKKLSGNRVSKGENAEQISNNFNQDMNDLHVRSISQDEDLDNNFDHTY